MRSLRAPVERLLEQAIVVFHFVMLGLTSFLSNAAIQKQERMPLAARTGTHRDASEPKQQADPPRSMKDDRKIEFFADQPAQPKKENRPCKPRTQLEKFALWLRIERHE